MEKNVFNQKINLLINDYESVIDDENLYPQAFEKIKNLVIEAGFDKNFASGLIERLFYTPKILNFEKFTSYERQNIDFHQLILEDSLHVLNRQSSAYEKFFHKFQAKNI
jgi:hypothetical protein